MTWLFLLADWYETWMSGNKSEFPMLSGTVSEEWRGDGLKVTTNARFALQDNCVDFWLDFALSDSLTDTPIIVMALEIILKDILAVSGELRML